MRRPLVVACRPERAAIKTRVTGSDGASGAGLSPSHRDRPLSLRRQGRTLVLTLAAADRCGSQAAMLRNARDAAIGLSASPGGHRGQAQQRWHLTTL